MIAILKLPFSMITVMIDTRVLDDKNRQLIVSMSSDYPIFKIARRLNISFFGGVLFDEDDVKLVMYLEKPKDFKREDTMFLSNVPYKDMGNFLIVTDSSNNFSELKALGHALRIRSVVLDTIHFMDGNVVVYLRYFMADEALITKLITFSSKYVPGFSLEYLGKGDKFLELFSKFNNYAKVSIISISYNPEQINDLEKLEQKDYIMEVKYAEKEKIVCVYQSKEEISNERIHKIKGEKEFFSGEVLDERLRELLSFLTTEDILTFRRVVRFQKGKYDIDFYILKSAQDLFLKNIGEFNGNSKIGKLEITNIKTVDNEG
ncbi:MAG: hypothetical protein ACYCR7_01440 [Thermoplasmataceae archaeon]